MSALFAHGVVDPWPIHFKTGALRNGAFALELNTASAEIVPPVLVGVW
jgi:hypothetical protein